MNKQFEMMQAQTDKETDLKVAAAEEGTLVVLSKKRATQKIQKFRWFKQHSWLFGGIAFLVWISGFLSRLYEFDPIFSVIAKYIPPKLAEVSSQVTVFTIMWSIIIGGSFAVAGRFISYMSSPEREEKLYKKYYKEHKETLEEKSKK